MRAPRQTFNNTPRDNNNMHAWRLPVQYNIVYIVYCIHVTCMRRAGVRRSLQSCLPPRYCDVSAGQCARVQHDNNNIIAFTSSSSSNYTAAAGGVRIASSAVRVRARAASLCGSCVRASAIPWVVARVRVRECAECSTIILLPSDFSVWVRAHRPSSALLNTVIAVLLFTRCSIDRDRIPDVRSRSLFCFRVPCTPPSPPPTPTTSLCRIACARRNGVRPNSRGYPSRPVSGTRRRSNSNRHETVARHGVANALINSTIAFGESRSRSSGPRRPIRSTVRRRVATATRTANASQKRRDRRRPFSRGGERSKVDPMYFYGDRQRVRRRSVPAAAPPHVHGRQCLWVPYPCIIKILLLLYVLLL